MWALVPALALLSFGCGGNGDGDGVTATKPPSVATATPAGAAPQGLGEFAGTPGLATTPAFRLERGQVVFRLTHDGEGEFLAVLTDSNGNQTAALVGGAGTRVSGRMDETKTVNITFPGLHVIEVNADGNWTIDISQ